MVIDNRQFFCAQSVVPAQISNIFEDVFRAKYFCMLEIHLFFRVVIESGWSNCFKDRSNPFFEFFLLNATIGNSGRFDNDFPVSRFKVHFVVFFGLPSRFFLLIHNVFEQFEELLELVVLIIKAGLNRLPNWKRNVFIALVIPPYFWLFLRLGLGSSDFKVSGLHRLDRYLINLSYIILLKSIT